MRCIFKCDLNLKRMTHYYNPFYDVLLYFCLKYVIILDIVKTFHFYIRY